MTNLFADDRVNVPLAEQLRPQTPDQLIGQPHSMILWGAPGVGKTTLVRMMATQFSFVFIALSKYSFSSDFLPQHNFQTRKLTILGQVLHG